MGIKVKLLNRDGSFFREVEIPRFYVRPDAIVVGDSVFVTRASEDKRKGLEYIEVMSTSLEP
jgi:hypothetical protein